MSYKKKEYARNKERIKNNLPIQDDFVSIMIQLLLCNSISNKQNDYICTFFLT